MPPRGAAAEMAPDRRVLAPSPPLAVFCRLWALQLLVRAASTLAQPDSLEGVTMILLPALVVALPTTPGVLVPAFVCRICQIYAKIPFIYDSQHWALQWDLAFLLPLLCATYGSQAIRLPLL